MSVYDAALLVGAVSDNLATNACCGCAADAVRGGSRLGYRRHGVARLIRNERTADLPWTPSYGTGAELRDLMRRLGEGDVISAPT